MYICDSNVVVTGISSVVLHDIDCHDISSQTLEALRQISSKFDQVPADKLEKALWSVCGKHDYHFPV